MKYTYLILFALLGISASQAQRFSDADVLFTNSSHEVICEGTELDGSQLVRAFSSGKTARDAKKQIEKNALYAILFKGILTGKEGCLMRPLANSENYRNDPEYKKRFNKFFSDNGSYKRYVTSNDTPRKTTKKYRGEGKEKIFSMIVSVKMDKLERALQKAEIIYNPRKSKTKEYNKKKYQRKREKDL